VLTRTELFGLRFVDAADIGDVATAVLSGADRDLSTERPLPIVVTPNVDQLVLLDRDFSSTAADMVRRAAYTLPDGQPIVAASRLLKTPLQARLTGSDLVAKMWTQLVAESRSTLVVATSNNVADKIRQHHAAAIAVVAPVLDTRNQEQIDSFARDAIAALSAADPEFVFVTLGFPKQEHVIDAMLRNWPSERPMPMFLAVGASFDMYYGIRRRAPRWVQRLGMEWLFRFAQEPRRLFARYFLRDPSFFKLVWREWRHPSRRHPVASSPSHL
jgi:N-acetylglucosaminyldiphosphoundecaprenol N-acetyl-beta-D-mannosaminyltransferase